MNSTLEARFEVVIDSNVMVPMRDGIALATDIYWPARGLRALDGPFPAVLERGPHGKSHIARRFVAGEFWAQRGYVAVIQDSRGCFASEGVWTSEAQEIDDGRDTLSWIVEQSWCDGSIFGHGTSYQGLTALALLRGDAPGLAGVWPHQGLDVHQLCSTVNGGALDLWHAVWLIGVAALNTSTTITSIPGALEELNQVDPREWLKAISAKPGYTMFTPVANYESWFLDAIARPVEDNFGLGNVEACADVPAYFSSSWFDSEARATVERYTALARRNNHQVRLLMGPWAHGHMSANRTSALDVEFGDEARIPDWPAFMAEWFEELRDGRTQRGDSSLPVRIFVMGGGGGQKTGDGKLFHGGHWRDEPNWPLDRAESQAYFLEEDGALTQEPGDAPHSITFTFDPRHPVPTVGGSFVGFTAPRRLPPGVPPLKIPFLLRREPFLMPGPTDQRTNEHVYGADPPFGPLADRSDVLVFQTRELGESLEVTGAVVVELYVSSSAPDTDFTAKLIDVYPPNDDYPEGYALPLCDGIFRTRYRESWETPSFMEAGETYFIRIELGPTSNLFAAQHRIRLDVSSSNFPQFDVNPNTGEPVLGATHMRIAENTVHLGKARPSRLVLPVVTHER